MLAQDPINLVLENAINCKLLRDAVAAYCGGRAVNTVLARACYNWCWCWHRYVITGGAAVDRFAEIVKIVKIAKNDRIARFARIGKIARFNGFAENARFAKNDKIDGFDRFDRFDRIA